MVGQTTDVDRYIGRMLYSFLNKQHKKDAEEYLFIRERIDKVNNYTRRNDVQSLLVLDKYAKDKPFNKLTQNDMLKWEEFLEKELKLNKSTIEQYEAHIKRFYKYLSNKDEYKKGKRFQKNIPYPENVSWISTSSGNHKEIPTDRLITEEHLLKLLDICEQSRDQAMYSSAFFDGGLRIGEVIGLNLHNVEFDKLGGKFTIPISKTEKRVVRLFLMPSSIHYLREFYNKHPFKKYRDKFNVPLFYSRDMRTYLKVFKKAQEGTVTQDDFEKIRLTRAGIRNSLITHCKMAGIPRFNPHVLRHTSATLCVKRGFNEMELRIRYGWSPTSKMPSKYTHLASKDIDDKIKVITGFKEPTEPEKSKLIPVECWNCKTENPPTFVYCGKCGSNLKPKKEEIIPDAIDTGIVTQEAIQNPEFREFYNEMLVKTWKMYKEMKTKQK